MYMVRDKASGKIVCHSYPRRQIGTDWHLIAKEDIREDLGIIFKYDEYPHLYDIADGCHFDLGELELEVITVK